MDPPFHQLRHTSRARAHGVHLWTLKVWGWAFPTYGPSHTSFLTERLFGPKAPWASYQCHGHFWDCNFHKEGHSTQWGTKVFYNDGSLITCVALQCEVLSQSLPHRNTQYRISFGEKRCHSKHSYKTHLVNEVMERRRKNTLWAAISMGRVFSALEKYMVSFNLTQTSCPLWRHGCQQGGLLATDIFLETGQERMKISCKNLI